MDLNQLLFEHQVALMRAGSRDRAYRTGASAMVRHYKGRIDHLRQQLGVSPYAHWCALSVGAAS